MAESFLPSMCKALVQIPSAVRKKKSKAEFQGRRDNVISANERKLPTNRTEIIKSFSSAQKGILVLSDSQTSQASLQKAEEVEGVDGVTGIVKRRKSSDLSLSFFPSSSN